MSLHPSMCRRRGNAGTRARGGCVDIRSMASGAQRVRPVPPRGEAGAQAMVDETDEALMLAVAARQQQAFRILMGRHMPRALRVAQRVVRNAAEADEIGQEAFLRIWTRAASFDPAVARFTTWLYRIVLNLAFDRVRRPAFAPIEDAGDVRDDRPEPVERLIADQERRMLEQAMAQLSDRQRGAIALFHMEGLSGEESAAAMNISAKAFESLLARARIALRDNVKKLQDDRRYA
ncbi:MAG: RNA polymerase sigma factor [Tardiphaga sp.]|nr:RNA polymerase sigma factor [Tardiphaga sp.]